MKRCLLSVFDLLFIQFWCPPRMTLFRYQGDCTRGRCPSCMSLPQECKIATSHLRQKTCFFTFYTLCVTMLYDIYVCANNNFCALLTFTENFCTPSSTSLSVRLFDTGAFPECFFPVFDRIFLKWPKKRWVSSVVMSFPSLWKRSENKKDDFKQFRSNGRNVSREKNNSSLIYRRVVIEEGAFARTDDQQLPCSSSTHPRGKRWPVHRKYFSAPSNLAQKATHDDGKG